MPAIWQQWMKHDINAWLSSTELHYLSDAAYRAVHNLLMAQFQSEDGMLPADEAQLSKLSRKRADWPDIRAEVLDYFTKGGEDKIYHPRCYREWERAKEVYEGRSKGGVAVKEVTTPLKGTLSPPIRHPQGTTDTDTDTSTDTSTKPLAQSTNVLNAVVRIPLVDSSTYDITAEQVAHWATLYPAVDVEQELRKMVGWTESHPRNRKTPRGIKGFVTGWLAREQDKGRVQVKTQATVGMHDGPGMPPEEIERLRAQIDSRRANA